jgi:hypothetical protein
LYECVVVCAFFYYFFYLFSDHFLSWQLVFQMWGGSGLRETIMFWWWICLDLVLNISLTSAVGNSLWSQFLCLLIRWWVPSNFPFSVWVLIFQKYYLFMLLCPFLLSRSTVSSLFTRNHFFIEISSQTTFLWAWEGVQIRSWYEVYVFFFIYI